MESFLSHGAAWCAAHLQLSRKSLRAEINRAPAFFFGLCGLLGAAAVYAPSFSYLFPLALLFFFAPTISHRFVSLAFCGFFFLYSLTIHHFPPIPSESAQGEGVFTIESIARQSGPFNKTLLYKGKLDHFQTTDGRVFHSVPCRAYMPLGKERPVGSTALRIQGNLLQKEAKNYVLKMKSWEGGAPNVSELRFTLKERFFDYLQKKIPDSRTRVFLSSMITGDIEERLISMEFGRLGLQHILGVSGFQFLLLAAALGLILRLALPYRWAAALLLVLLTAYFLLLGPSPPVMRAWAASTLYLAGILLNKPTTAINALGVGLLCELALDPLVVCNIGFQLSFVCTAAILLVYAPMHRLFLRLFPQRPLSELKKFSLIDKHGYIIGALLRESLSLNIAVHLLVLPVLLSLFGKFPLLSLAYNLFFPFLAALSFCLLLAALAVPFLFPLCNVVTKAILILTTYPPTMWDISLRVRPLPLSGAVILLTLSIALFLTLGQKPRDLPESGKDSLGFV